MGENNGGRRPPDWVPPFGFAAFSPELLLPEQTEGDAARWVPRSVRALMLAILWQAVDDLRQRGRERHADAARAWVAASDPGWPFSFDSICDALRLGADRLRARLLGAAAVPLPRRRPQIHQRELREKVRTWSQAS